LVAEYIDSRDADADLLGICEAITATHDLVGVANPVATIAVKEVLARRLSDELPRAWPAADKLHAATLDKTTLAIIVRRENERDTVLRRAQNAISEQRKELQRLIVGAQPKKELTQ
jgi:hypothetical protein